MLIGLPPASFFGRIKETVLGPPPLSLDTLKRKIGADDFYNFVAKLESDHEQDWLRMAQVQQRFKAAEPLYRTDEARVYSESNRETLHRLTIALFERGDTAAYHDFIELHPTVFAENGACVLPPDEQLFILSKTHPDMFKGVTFQLLFKGIFLESKWTQLVHQCAEATRASRRARGLPVTRPS